jgi:hypothetical protein
VSRESRYVNGGHSRVLSLHSSRMRGKGGGILRLYESLDSCQVSAVGILTGLQTEYLRNQGLILGKGKRSFPFCLLVNGYGGGGG